MFVSERERDGEVWENWLIANAISPLPGMRNVQSVLVVRFLLTLHQGEEGASKLAK